MLKENKIVYSYTISDLDVLFHIIVPFFSNLQFKTRKLIDFNLWVIAIKLHIYGYYLKPEGRALLLKISQSTNKARYGNKVELPTQSEIDNVFKIEPPFSLAYEHRLWRHRILKQRSASVNIWLRNCVLLS